VLQILDLAGPDDKQRVEMIQLAAQVLEVEDALTGT
jgi:hypothetical protein